MMVNNAICFLNNFLIVVFFDDLKKLAFSLRNKCNCPQEKIATVFACSVKIITNIFSGWFLHPSQYLDEPLVMGCFIP
jgi:hypothetical protein